MEHFEAAYRIHIAATVSWHHKGALQFYNDEPLPTRPRKPRRSQYETDAQFNQRLLEWHASLPARKGHSNLMTMLYYTHKLLPIYTEEIYQHRMQGLDCLFEQDNDPSHGTRTADNLAQYFLRSNWIELFDHPPQSADLSPIEGCWNILK
jgi:hypothetical protein